MTTRSPLRPQSSNRTMFLFLICMLSLCTHSSTQYPHNQASSTWHENLPACPCENPDLNSVKLNDGWAEDTGEIEKYHPGATHCFRSYPYTKTQEGKSGQQCCYDSTGKLITSGSGAGTPDKVSTCSGEKKDGSMHIRTSGLWGHYFRDVRPWIKFGGVNGGWKQYNKAWVPNQGDNCVPNIVTKE